MSCLPENDRIFFRHLHGYIFQRMTGYFSVYFQNRKQDERDRQLHKKVAELQTQTQRLERKIALLKTENETLVSFHFSIVCSSDDVKEGERSVVVCTSGL